LNDDARIRQELTRVANSRPKSGRGLQAKIVALRTLERMNRAGEEVYGSVDPELVARLFDERPDSARVDPLLDWYPTTGSSGDAVMKELAAWDTLGQRRRLFLNLSEEGEL
jgi:hypothetical protein